MLTEDEHLDGTCLTCRAVPDTDITIELRGENVRLVNTFLHMINDKARRRAEAHAAADLIFGPVCVVNSFDTEEEVVHLANDTRYGLNAMLFTENLSRAHRVASTLRAGTVWVNCFFIRDLRTPFGGVGDSGVGREGGNFSREFFTEPKTVVMQIDRG